MTLPWTAVMGLEAFYFLSGFSSNSAFIFFFFNLCSWQLSAIPKHKNNLLF